MDITLRLELTEWDITHPGRLPYRIMKWREKMERLCVEMERKAVPLRLK